MFFHNPFKLNNVKREIISRLRLSAYSFPVETLRLDLYDINQTKSEMKNIIFLYVRIKT